MNTQERGIPIKIEPDNIVDSIILLQFETEYNKKKIESELASFLNDTYSDNHFLPTPLRKKDVESMNQTDADGCFSKRIARLCCRGFASAEATRGQ